jgi:hypothetical protein
VTDDWAWTESLIPPAKIAKNGPDLAREVPPLCIASFKRND